MFAKRRFEFVAEHEQDNDHLQHTDVETLQPTQIHVSDRLSQRDADRGQPGTRLDSQSSVDVDDAVPVPHVHRQPGPMRRALDWKDLTAIGVGGTIGAGIFVVTGFVAHHKTGPALFISYLIAGFTCLLSAFSYAEFSSMVPSAGSAYTYARATLGQLMGWIIGWDLILEYTVAAASVAQGWSHYLGELLRLMGIRLPHSMMSVPFAPDPVTGRLVSTGAVMDVPAFLVCMAVTFLLVRGIQESAIFNNAMVVLKVMVILLVCGIGVFYMEAKNFSPFMPYGFGGWSFFGVPVFGSSDESGEPTGVLAGAALVFFAYIGFDCVTCQTEEAINPQRDVPRGVLCSLGISTVLYISVALVLCGMVPYQQINDSAPLSSAFGTRGLAGAQAVIAVGALAGVSSVLTVTLMGQPRIFMAMSRDGLLPNMFAELHPSYRTPWRSTMLVGGVAAFLSSLIPLSVLVELVSIGTLFAFFLVSCGIIILRRTKPNLARPFRCPWVPWLPGAGACCCLLLMISLPTANWLRLILWLAIGLGIYYFYGRVHGHERVSGALLPHTEADSAMWNPQQASERATASVPIGPSMDVELVQSDLLNDESSNDTARPGYEADDEQAVPAGSSLRYTIEAEANGVDDAVR